MRPDPTIVNGRALAPFATDPRRACNGSDPDMFYPDDRYTENAAVNTCTGCWFRARCLLWALVADERHGIWGGVAERHRPALQRRLKERQGVARDRATERETRAAA